MGTTCACEKIESEEERINRIMNTMSLSFIESHSAYSEFLTCLNDKEELDYFLFLNYLQKIVGDNIYTNIQSSYFKNLVQDGKNRKNVKKIGIIIILLSKSNFNNEKIELLNQHFLRFYLGVTVNVKKLNQETPGKDTETVGNAGTAESVPSDKLINSLKEFLDDLINCNTDDCILPFQQYMGNEGTEHVSKMWSKIRRKKLKYNILMNLENLKGKFILNKKNKLYNSINNLQVQEGNSNNQIPDEIENELDSPIYYSEDSESENENQSSSKKKYKNTFTISLYNIKITYEFFELTYPQLNGDYIRDSLYDEYMKEKTYDKVCI